MCHRLLGFLKDSGYFCKSYRLQRFPKSSKYSSDISKEGLQNISSQFLTQQYRPLHKQCDWLSISFGFTTQIKPFLCFTYSLDAGRNLKVQNMFRRRPGHFLNVLYRFKSSVHGVFTFTNARSTLLQTPRSFRSLTRIISMTYTRIPSSFNVWFSQDVTK